MELLHFCSCLLQIFISFILFQFVEVYCYNITETKAAVDQSGFFNSIKQIQLNVFN